MAIFGKFQNEQENKNAALRMAWFINLVLSLLLFAVMVFAVKIYNNRTVVVTIPPQIAGQQTFILGVNKASKNTYSVFAQYFAQLIGNFSYKNVDSVIKELVKFYSASIQHERYSYLLNLATFIKSNYVTQNFNVQKIDVHSRRDGSVEAYVYGLISRKIGGNGDIKDFPYLYHVVMRVEDGNIYIIAPITSEFKPKTINEKNILKNFREKNKYFN